jgi:hypothetical protein
MHKGFCYHGHDTNKGWEVKNVDDWEELLLHIVLLGGSFEVDGSGGWILELSTGDEAPKFVAVTRRPATPTEFAQLLAALTQLGMAWPPFWRGRLN